MTLPRWTTYPALAVIAVIFVTAIPRRTVSPHGDDARAAREAAGVGAPASTPTPPASKWKRVVVLGIDGLDPVILAAVIDRFPERMPNFRSLISEGSGLLTLGTSTPPQSPVAWSNFITGRRPGGHGIFDFIHRNPATYLFAPSTVAEAESGTIHLPGEWKFPTGGGGDSNRSGQAFWGILADHDVPADVYRMPINFPVEPGLGVSFPGMMTPALDSAYGEFTWYSTELGVGREINGGKIVEILERNGVIRTSLFGPPNAMKEGDPVERVPLDIYVTPERDAIAIAVGDSVLTLQPGEWSGFTTVTYSLLPAGLMDLSGIVRFYLRRIDPELELYASPINFDPYAPVEPVSQPEDASAELADAIGLYYTQGMSEEVAGLKTRVLTDAEFMQQSDLVFQERGRMLDYALDRYLAAGDGGFLFFYYSTVDLCCHMMWRHSDEEHPFHDHDLASESSSWWSGRPEGTWHDVIHDLYLQMDPVLGKIRERVGEDTLLIVMSDHGFAPYRRKFNLNSWLHEHGYLVLMDGNERELPADDPDHVDKLTFIDADWSKSRAYGIGFNGLYLNLAGRESQGIVQAEDVDALLAELEAELERIDDDGTRVVLSAELARDIYAGERVAEAPDIIVGYNSGYGNSDEATLGRIPYEILADNRGGTFNGSHLMAPSVVPGVLITNGEVVLEDPRLEDLTVEILSQYGIEPTPGMVGRQVLQKPNQ